MENCIRVQGARVNNLKNISVEIPRDKLVVLDRPVRLGQVISGL